ncbi:MAG TPA: hypothetical protein DCZ94_13805 [Lentisphaeria bacterium]|nr:MAG: hypothetical protein A2X48_15680 [Lentisphaerae bacterium GWF2_49_21]HBC88021.1 hypothetical protein [Lentisphaeria bacterium]
MPVFFRMVFAAILVSIVAGCASTYSFRNIESVYTFQKFNESRLVSDLISPDTIQYLRLNFLEGEYAENPEAVIEALVGKFDNSRETSVIMPICELSYSQGFKFERKDPLKAASYYALCASFSYDYLHRGIFQRTNYMEISSKLLLAAGLYNSSISRGVMLWQKTDTTWDKGLDLDLGYRKYSITVRTDDDHLFNPDFFNVIRSAYDYDVQGFTNSFRSNGLGASLFGVHEKREEIDDEHYPKHFFLPMTAVLEFKPMPVDMKQPRKADLRFYNALRTDKMDLGGAPFRIDADFTIPLAVFLADNDPSRFSFMGLKNPSKLREMSNIFMMEPYDPGKIPLLLVHGLYSSPATFLEMYNDFLGIPEIRLRYQIWFFYYPTGLPITDSSSILRRNLKGIHDKYNSDGKNPNFNNMLVVGHSMGGILTDLMTKDSGTKFYDSVFNVPLDSGDFTPQEKELLKQNMFFAHFPFIKRCVFIATPHRGSDIAIAWWARILSRTISLPADFVNATSDVIIKKKRLLKEMPPEYQDVIPTSVQQLAPKARIIQVNSELPYYSGLKYHSIIGIRDADKGSGSSDGIVPYESSHLDGALSEYLVKDSHTCVSNPYTIAEVKRIALLHLKEIDDQKAELKEKETDSGTDYVKFSKVMLALSNNQEFMERLMNGIGRDPDAGGVLGPEELQLLKKLIFSKDFALFDFFPGFTVRGMGLAYELAGNAVKKRQENNPDAAVKADEYPELKADVVEELGIPVKGKVNPPAIDSLLRDIGPGLKMGELYDPEAIKMRPDNLRMAEVLNRLSLNPAEKGKPKYVIRMGEDLVDTPQALIEKLINSNCKVEVRDARYFANFGKLFYNGQEVLTAYWINTEFPIPGTDKTLLVPVGHSQHELNIEGSDFKMRLIYYFGSDGKLEFRSFDTVDQTWIGGRVAKIYDGKQAIEVVRIAGESIRTYKRIQKENPDLPFGGYYKLGVCLDANAIIEFHMTGRTTQFPLTHDVKYFKGDSEVEKIMRKLPCDGGDVPPDPQRIVGSMPADDISKLTIPELREQLKLIKDARMAEKYQPIQQGK